MDKIFEESDRIERLIKASRKSVDKAILKLVEELGELVSSIEALSSYKSGNYEHVQEEVVDMLERLFSDWLVVGRFYAQI